MSDPRLDQLTDFTFAYAGGPRFYVGFETLARTASAAGSGSQTADGDYIRARTATGVGVAGGSADYIEILPRTATGSGTGATGESTDELLIARRTGSASGVGASNVLSGLALKKAAFGSGSGGSSASALIGHLRAAGASGTGGSSVTQVMIAKRLAEGSGTSGSTADYIEVLPRTATASGTGSTGGQVTWDKSLIFRPPVNDSFAWANRNKPVPGDFVLRKLVPGGRAKNVYKLNDGSFTFNQPPRPDDYVRVYLGGHNNFVSEAEKQDLVAAGFGDLVT